jgi:hypothetical protein
VNDGVYLALIAEVERLRQESADFEGVCLSQEGQIARLMAELATAKKVGAAECLQVLRERYHDEVPNTYGRWVSQADIEHCFQHYSLPEPPAELRAEAGK